MPKSQSVALYVNPPQPARASFPYAPYQHFWGMDQPSEHRNVWVPTDLGRIVLSPGVRVSGRMVDLDGRPIAGQTIRAYAVRGRDTHFATTETDGTFALGPLRPANYLVYGQGQEELGGVSPNLPALSKPIRVIRPVRVYLREGVLPPPLVLREVPTVEVEVRFVDSRGQPAPAARPKSVASSRTSMATPIPSAPSRRRAISRRRSTTPNRKTPPTVSTGPFRTAPTRTAGSSSALPKDCERSIYSHSRPMSLSLTRPAWRRTAP